VIAVRRDGGAPIGKLLLERGVLPDARALDDAIARQSQRLPLASLCYVLGYAPERPLIATLVAMRGVPGVVLDESVIHLDVLGALARETAARARILPVFEDARRVVLACADPEGATGMAAELERVRGKRVDVHIALEITLARAIRGAYLARTRGDSYWVGVEAIPDPNAPTGKVATVAPDDPEAGRTDPTARAHRAVIDDVTKELAITELFLDEDMDISSVVERAMAASHGQRTHRADDSVDSQIDASTGARSTNEPRASDSISSSIDTPWPSDRTDVDDANMIDLIAELDALPSTRRDGPPRVLIVDDDFATRHFLVKELQPLGYQTSTAPSGGEAVGQMRQGPPDLIICDVLLPEIDGFRLCRAIKKSRSLAQVPVVLMSAVIDSGRVTDDVLARYGADAYLEKPLDTRRVHKVIRDLLGRRRGKSATGESGFHRAIELYQRGEIDLAIQVLRDAVDADPSSAKYRFVLANLLQRKAMVSDAIDEYESVLQLEPDYFPALTRLAYLYYKQGLVARAVDTWRKSLPLCGDPGLRRNIELFMRKLIAEMGAVSGASS
jgi:DNA-binding response OmpR family regulator